MTPRLIIPRRWLLLSAALALPLAGCGKKPDPQAGLSDLEKAFPAASAPAPAPSQPAAPPAAVPAPANPFVSQAITAARANDFAASVIALQAAQQSPGVTAEQVMAVQRAKAAIIGDLQRRAAAGDPTALAQLQAIEKTRSQ